MKTFDRLCISSTYYDSTGFDGVLRAMFGDSYAMSIFPEYADEIEKNAQLFMEDTESSRDAYYLSFLATFETVVGFDPDIADESNVINYINKCCVPENGYYLYNTSNYDAWEVFELTCVSTTISEPV